MANLPTTVIAKDDRLRWPDSLAEMPDGAILVTASHIQAVAQFHETAAFNRDCGNCSASTTRMPDRRQHARETIWRRA
jgi:hypothetical protein